MPNTLPISPGLDDAEAARRLAAEGYNELPRSERRTLWRVAVGVVVEPMFGLLLTAGVIYLLIGSLEEALLLLAFATISVTIAVARRA